jgi:hypothetical protein
LRNLGDAVRAEEVVVLAAYSPGAFGS